MVFRNNIFQISEWLATISDYVTRLPDFNMHITLYKRKPLNLDSLPIEILLLVHSYLPPESILALSLTTKRFWHSLSPNYSIDITKPIPTSPAMRQRFLTLLERDTPNQLLCQTCTKLYTWNRPSSTSHSCPRESCNTNPPLPLLDLCPSTHPYQVTRSTVRLLLRSQTHSPRHGLPLSTLSHTCTIPPTPSTPAIQISHHPKIIQGRVLLHTRCRTMLRTSDHLSTQLAPLGKSTCIHASKYIPDVAVYAVDRVLEQSGGKCSESVKCTDCETDVSVRAATELQGDTAMVVVVTVDIWRDLGGEDDEDERRDAMGGLGGVDLKFLRGTESKRRKRKDGAVADLDVVFVAGSFEKMGALELLGWRYLLENAK